MYKRQVQPEYAPHGLDDLIDLETGVNEERRKPPVQAGKGAERDARGPQEEDIREHQEFCVAAAA